MGTTLAVDRAVTRQSKKAAAKAMPTVRTSARFSKTLFNGFDVRRTHIVFMRIGDLCLVACPAMAILMRRSAELDEVKEIADGFELQPRCRLPQTG
jgi:hypothetical protein